MGSSVVIAIMHVNNNVSRHGALYGMQESIIEETVSTTMQTEREVQRLQDGLDEAIEAEWRLSYVRSTQMHVANVPQDLR